VPRLRRLLRLFAVTVLVVTGTCAIVSSASAGEGPRDRPVIRGFDQKELIAVCDRYQGRYVEDLPKPYRYGCVLSDGDIKCQEQGKETAAQCSFFRLSGRPFEESCERVGDKFTFHDVLNYFSCWNRNNPPVLLQCDPEWDVCVIGHEQPMP
jgi:hypothetical protein